MRLNFGNSQINSSRASAGCSVAQATAEESYEWHCLLGSDWILVLARRDVFWHRGALPFVGGARALGSTLDLNACGFHLSALDVCHGPVERP